MPHCHLVIGVSFFSVNRNESSFERKGFGEKGYENKRKASSPFFLFFSLSRPTT
jgi:hypothetical protein